MKTPLRTLLATTLAFAFAFGGPAQASFLSAAAVAAPAPAAAPAEADAAVLAQMTQAVRDGRFGAAFKRGLRTVPPGELRNRVLALDDNIIGGVFARIAARRFTIGEATAIAAFYASPEGRVLTEAQLADPLTPPPTPPAAQREAIATFFSSETGRKFNAVLADEALIEELQLALAFIAGPEARK